MSFTTRQDFPDSLPPVKTMYCWYCRSTDLTEVRKDVTSFVCAACGRSAERVLIYDPVMALGFDAEQRLYHESAGVFIINPETGKLLLFKRTKYPFQLTIPAGHMEVGEDPLLCAVRECQEEVGFEPLNPRLVFEGDLLGESCLGGADIHKWHAYLALMNPTEIKLDTEGSAWDWYDVNELKDNEVVAFLQLMFKVPGLREHLAKAK